MCHIDFRTFYNQFYITSDNGIKALIDLEWTDKAYEDRIGAYENMIVVYPESYGHIMGELHLLDAKNTADNLEEYDHVIEGGLNVESGQIQILDCPTSTVQMKFTVKPGLYTVRICFSNMNGYDSDEEENNDRCKIEIWPSDLYIKSHVLKRFPRNF
jgi:hypothetical protein